jgi:rhodanese-related sulfurtransferase
MNKYITPALYTIIVVLVTSLLIYLTPLKWLNIVEPAMNEMDPAEFQKELVAHPEDYLFIDVRQKTVYEVAHAKGSVSQPIATLFDLRNTLPRTGKKIALICTSGRLAAVGYGYLQSQGYTNLIHVKGGLQAWAAEGLPIEGTNTLTPLPEQD